MQSPVFFSHPDTPSPPCVYLSAQESGFQNASALHSPLCPTSAMFSKELCQQEAWSVAPASPPRDNALAACTGHRPVQQIQKSQVRKDCFRKLLR